MDKRVQDAFKRYKATLKHYNKVFEIDSNEDDDTILLRAITRAESSLDKEIKTQLRNVEGYKRSFVNSIKRDEEE